MESMKIAVERLGKRLEVTYKKDKMKLNTK